MLTYADVCNAETAQGRQAAGEKLLDEPDRQCRVRLPPGCVVKLVVKLAVKLVVNLVVKLEVLLDMAPTAKARLAIRQGMAVLAPLRLIHL
jgi:hypothetical protein